MQMPWGSASGRTVLWRSVSELSRLHLKCLERLVRPDAKDAKKFFPDVASFTLLLICSYLSVI